ncbi:MAG TPA: S8 family peptidase [Actinomycetota bacterium]|nr:S8 family peptidase [Actinomycetota bacterium]
MSASVRSKRLTAVVAVLAAALSMLAVPARDGSSVPVMVLEARPASQAAESVVRAAGGRIGASLDLIGGFAARIPAAAIRSLLARPEIAGVLPDAQLRLAGKGGGGGGTPATSSTFAAAVDAPRAWSGGITGRGVNVAVLDSGIAPVADLTAPANRIVAWKDFVSGSPSPVDPHGHGTFVAGIIAANGAASGGARKGIAPEAGLVGVRVFDEFGSATASRVIQGIQWIIQNRATHGIRVVNMSFSTTSDLSYKIDAVTYAAEQAWRAGIVVVASAGNAGPAPGTILSPGIDPFVITVGASDDRGTAARDDDTIASFSGAGPTRLDLIAKPDLIAPGVWTTGLRVPGSLVDVQHTLSRRDEHYFDGSGTSPAAGVVSGVAALMLHKRPKLDPDQVKAVLKQTTTPAPFSLLPGQAGAGVVNASNAASSRITSRDNAGHVPASGGGLLSLVGIPDVKWR